MPLSLAVAEKESSRPRSHGRSGLQTVIRPGKHARAAHPNQSRPNHTTSTFWYSHSQRRGREHHPQRVYLDRTDSAAAQAGTITVSTRWNFPWCRDYSRGRCHSGRITLLGNCAPDQKTSFRRRCRPSACDPTAHDAEATGHHSAATTPRVVQTPRSALIGREWSPWTTLFPPAVVLYSNVPSLRPRPTVWLILSALGRNSRQAILVGDQFPV